MSQAVPILDFLRLNLALYEPSVYKNSIASEDHTGFPTNVSSLVNGTQNAFSDGKLNHIGWANVDIGTQSKLNLYRNYAVYKRFYDKGADKSFGLSTAMGQQSATASIFSALMSNRNGPWGFPTWKQIRVSDTPLIRKQRTESIITVVDDTVLPRTKKINGRFATFTRKHGAIQQFNEAVIAHSIPLKFDVGIMLQGDDEEYQLQRASLSVPLGNEITFFDNEGLNNKYDRLDCKGKSYDAIKEYYLDGKIDSYESPVDTFERIRYSTTIFPKRLNMYMSYVRERQLYAFPYNSDREKRTLTDVDDNFTADVATIDVRADGTSIFVDRSMWPLDISQQHGSGISRRMLFHDYYVQTTNNNAGVFFTDYGILQNTYSSFIDNASGKAAWISGKLGQHLRPAPLYSRKHMLLETETVRSPSGMKIDGITGQYNETSDLSDMSDGELPCGEARWDTPKQSGYHPFFNSYGEYSSEIRAIGKEYSIIPEFRISDHISHYLSDQFSGVTQDNVGIFQTIGADKLSCNHERFSGSLFHPTLNNGNGIDSRNSKFFKTYSNSEFLKHFDMIVEDHKDFVTPARIILKCKVIKKFLPYDGFYPAQRTVNIAEQFWDSYSENMIVNSSSAGPEAAIALTSSNVAGPLRQYRGALSAGQFIMRPLFAPGVLFNSIKAGVACDYPVITGSGIGGPHSLGHWKDRITSFTDGDSNLNYVLTTGSTDNKLFHERIPFEAIVDPESYMANIAFCSNEPHPSGSHVDVFGQSVVWNGKGDTLYKKMVNNFLAEVPEFFLKNDQFTTLYSQPDNDPNFGVAEEGKMYKMRVKIYKSLENTRHPIFASASVDSGVKLIDSGSFPMVFPPQYSSRDRENFTMYSRPSAFGPPSRFIIDGVDSIVVPDDFPFQPTVGSKVSKSLRGILSSSLGTIWPYEDVDWHPETRVKFRTVGNLSTRKILFPTNIGNNSRIGFNFPFTPPYYDGEAWADISFIATESRKYSLKEIVSSCHVDYLRYYDQNTLPDIMPSSSFSFPNLRAVLRNHFRNRDAMQVNSSINIFNIEETPNGGHRWVIQPKFETPMFNFNDYSGSRITSNFSTRTVTTFAQGKAAIPRGMWHQYGRYPTKKEGVFLQVSDVPLSWRVWSTDPSGLWQNASTDAWINLQSNFGAYVFDPPDLTITGSLIDMALGAIAPLAGIADAVTGGELSEYQQRLRRQQRMTRERKRLQLYAQESLQTAKQIGSLADLCGFKKRPVKMGQVPSKKIVKEAVVAIPFVEEEGKRKFFTLKRSLISKAMMILNDIETKGLRSSKKEKAPDDLDDVVSSKTIQSAAVPKSYLNLVRQLKEFVFPPQFDFVNFKKSQPIAMYAFEFKYEFDRKDLQNIWQNVMPRSALSHDVDEATVSHDLIPSEFLGDGDELPTKLRWMIFKVKQRAETEYYDKVAGLKKKRERRTALGELEFSNSIDDKVSYNWPYDFFSFVELVKVDATVDLNQTEMSEDEDKINVKPIINKNIMNIKKEEFDKIKVTEVKKDEFLE